MTSFEFLFSFLGLAWYGCVIAIIVFAIIKIKRKIRDKKRHEAWKAAADIAAAEQSEENKDL